MLSQVKGIFMSHKERQNAISNLIGKDAVYYDDRPEDEAFRNVVVEEDLADDFVTILRWLPEVVNDVEKTLEIITRLFSIMAIQQEQLAELNKRVEEVVRANIAIKIHENVNDIILQLAQLGCEIEDHEINVKMSATVSNETLENKQEHVQDIKSRFLQTQLGTEISGIIGLLANLEIVGTATKNRLRKIERSIESQIRRSAAESYAGDLTIKFGSLKGRPFEDGATRAKKQKISNRKQKQDNNKLEFDD
jgi:hypothetical protein